MALLGHRRSAGSLAEAEMVPANRVASRDNEKSAQLERSWKPFLTIMETVKPRRIANPNRCPLLTISRKKEERS